MDSGAGKTLATFVAVPLQLQPSCKKIAVLESVARYANTVPAKQPSGKVSGWGGNALQSIPLVCCQGLPGLCKCGLLVSAPEFTDGLPA